MKAFGFILIILSSAICGINFMGTKKERLGELHSCINMLELIRAELNTSLCPLNELLVKIEPKLEAFPLDFVRVLSLNFSALGEKGFSIIWRESLAACANRMKEDELDLLVSLGNVLGKYDLATQNEAIDECLIKFRENEKRELKDFPQLKRLSLGVSVSIGALLAIVLV